MLRKSVLLTLLVGVITLAPAVPAAALKVTWMAGYPAPGTPVKYDKVGVIKVGSPSARNVLVLEPGTSAAAAYFVPFAKWVASAAPSWQVWAVQRRETLLEDQSEVNLAKQHKASAKQVFDYYLGFLANRRITGHFKFIPDSSVEFAKQWGMNVAVHDLRRVIAAAHKPGGKVALGGHSLGGSVVTAYATWDFRGRAGADGLAALVYDDGGSLQAVSAQSARAALRTLDAVGMTPWLSFGGISAPFAGLFNTTGALGVLMDPNAPSLGQQFPLLPAYLKPTVPVTNEAQYGYALSAATSPPSLFAAQAHLGKGILGADGTEWYFPQRLTDDTGAVGNGIANPAQGVLDVHSTMGRRLPRGLRIYAISTALGGQGVLLDAKALAAQSQIPISHLTLVNRQASYSHNDPAGAYPHNAFFSTLIPFLAKIAAPASP